MSIISFLVLTPVAYAQVTCGDIRNVFHTLECCTANESSPIGETCDSVGFGSVKYKALSSAGAFRVPKVSVVDQRFIKIDSFEYKTYVELAQSITNDDYRRMAIDVVETTSRGLSAARSMITNGYWTVEEIDDYNAYWTLLNQDTITPNGPSKKTMDMLFEANKHDVEWFVANIDVYIFWFITRKCCYVMSDNVAVNSYSTTCFFNMMGRWNAIMNVPLFYSTAHEPFGFGLLPGVNENHALLGDHFYNADASDFEWKFRFQHYTGGPSDLLDASIKPEWANLTIADVAYEYYKAMGSFKFYSSKTGIPMPTNVVPGTLRDPASIKNGPLYKALKDHVKRCRDSIYLPYHFITTELRMYLESHHDLRENIDLLDMYEESYYDILEKLDYNPNTAQRIAYITSYLYIVDAGTDLHGRQMYKFAVDPPATPVNVVVATPGAPLELTLRGTGLSSNEGQMDLCMLYLELINCCWAYFFRETNYLRSQGAMVMLNSAGAKENAMFDFYKDTLVSYDGSSHYVDMEVDLYDPATHQVTPSSFHFDELALSSLAYSVTPQVLATGKFGHLNLNYGHATQTISATRPLRMPTSLRNTMRELLQKFESTLL